MLSNPITLYYCTGNCFCFGLLVGLWGCRNLTLKTIWSLVPFAIFCLCIFAHCFMFVCCNCLFAFWIKVQFRRRHRSSDKVALLMSYRRVGKVACTFSSFSSARIQHNIQPQIHKTNPSTRIQMRTTLSLKCIIYTSPLKRIQISTALYRKYTIQSIHHNIDLHNTRPQMHNTNPPPQHRFTQNSSSNTQCNCKPIHQISSISQFLPIK